MACGTAVLYLILYHLFLKKIRMQRLLEKSKGLIDFISLPVYWRVFDLKDTFPCMIEANEVFGIDNPAVEWTEENDTAKSA